MAQDMLISGRSERVVVVAGDNGSGGTLLPWLGENPSCIRKHFVPHQHSTHNLCPIHLLAYPQGLVSVHQALPRQQSQ